MGSSGFDDFNLPIHQRNASIFPKGHLWAGEVDGTHQGMDWGKRNSSEGK